MGIKIFFSLALALFLLTTFAVADTDIFDNINATGYNITASHFIGDGSKLTNVGLANESDPRWSGNLSNGISGNLKPDVDSSRSIGTNLLRWLIGWYDNLIVGEINATKINAADWSNVTITENQISDLQDYLVEVENDSVVIKYQNISNMPACTGTQKLTFDGAALYCASDIDTDTDTQKKAGGIYLYNNSDTIYVNETSLNRTADNIASRYNETNFVLNQGYLTNVANDSVIIKYQNISNIPTCSGSQKLTFNGAVLSCANDVDTDTQKTTSGPYLYNNTNTIFFNETKLNQTIDSRDSDTTYTAGSNLTLVGTEFSLNANAVRQWLDPVYVQISNIVSLVGNWSADKSNYYNKTESAGIFVNRSNWSTHDNYPTGCSAGQAVQIIGDTLTCVNVSSGNPFNQNLNTTNSPTFANLTLTGTVVNISADSSLKLYALNHETFGQGAGESIELRGLSPTSKPFIGWYHYDNATNQYRAVGWIGCHYNLSNGNVHSHCSWETLDNSTGTPTLNSHFEVSYGGSQERANVKFPTSDVIFITGQKLYFGDNKQASIQHLGTGKLVLNSTAGIQILGNLDLEQGDIQDVVNIQGAGNIDLEPKTAARIFPSGQTTIGLSVNNDSSGSLTMQGLGTSYIIALDNFNVSSGNNICITGGNCLSDVITTLNAGSNISISGAGNSRTIGVNTASLKSWFDTIYQAIGSYVLTSDVSNLNVNKSNYWDNYDSPSGWDLNDADDLKIADLPLANKTSPHCSNITGAASNLCTLADTDSQKSAGGFYLYNDTNSIYVNETRLNQTIDDRDSDTDAQTLSYNAGTDEITISNGNAIDISEVDTNTLYTNGSGLSLAGTQFNHTDTSNQASSDNSGRAYIQDILLDAFGHITSITTAVETVVDTTSFFIDTDGDASTEINAGETILFSNSTGMLINRSSNTINFATTLGNAIEKGEIANSGTLGFSWADGEIADTLTIGGSGSVAWSALTSYPAACSSNQYVSAFGDTLTCASISLPSTQLTDGGTIGFQWVDAEVADALTIGSSSAVADAALSSNVTLKTAANTFSQRQTFSGGINITSANTLQIGSCYEQWNGTCLNTYCSGTLIQSIGCA